ncbi:MAG: hypothetical protein K2Q26_10940 [Bdellovibrionales bacterium]|nr:hypothetical protein [Bdellovibrionales bacterium]
MPNVQKQNTPKKNNAQTKQELKKSSMPARARDNLAQAFAGNENKGPSGVKLNSHSTNTKSRTTRQSKERDPKR